MGDTLWTRKIETTTGVNSRYPVGYWDQNGDLVVRIRNNWDSEFVKFDVNGNYLSHHEFVANLGAKLHIYEAQNHGAFTYLVGNVNGGNSVIMKTDIGGNVIWCKSYSEFDTFFHLLVTSQNEIIVSSYSSVLKTDIDGNPIIAKNYGKLPSSHSFYSDILEINDQFILSGHRQYQTNITGYQLTLDNNLNSGSCYEKVINVMGTAITVNKNNIPDPIVNSLQSDIIFYGTNSTTGWFLNRYIVDYNLDNTLDTDIELIGDDCGGTCNGSAFATSIGGDPTYTYEWSDGQIGETASGLCYNSEITLLTGDQLGCYRYDTVIVSQQTPVPEICIVTVDSTSTKNLVVWEKEVSNSIAGYRIYRDVQGNYALVGYVPYDDLSQFEDNTNGVNPNITSYRYKISIVDTCGYESELSPYHETIHVTATEGLGGVVNLIWDNYEGFGFTNYEILKDTTDNGVLDFYVADQVSSISFTWTDNNPQDYVNYVINVLPPTTCSATIKAIDHNASRSNSTASISQGNGTNGIGELNENDFNIYPNPNKGEFTIEFDMFAESDMTFDIIDYSGNIVKTEKVYSQTGLNTVNVNLEDVASGIYVIRIYNENSIVMKRFTVTK